MLICHVETNFVFLPVVRQDPLPRKPWSEPTPGRFALIPKRNDTDSNQFRFSFFPCKFSFRNIKNYVI